MTIWHMLIACCITKATHTHTLSEYVILIVFLLQHGLHECASMLCLYVHCLSCFYLMLYNDMEILAIIVSVLLYLEVTLLIILIMNFHKRFPRRG